MRRAISILILAVTLAVCGDDDEESKPAPTYGTCDLRTDHHSCIEATSTPINIANQEDGCLDAGGAWSEEPCPEAADRIGCCTYTFGMSFRECFYAGHTRSDIPTWCTTTWDDGVWTPN